MVFSAAVGAGAETPANYSITAPNGSSLAVLAAYLSPNGTTVTLATELQQRVTYTLTIKGIKAATGTDAVIRTADDDFDGSGVKAPIVASAIALSNTEVLVTFFDPDSGKPAKISDSALNIKYYDIIAEGGNAGQTPDLKITGIEFVEATQNGHHGDDDEEDDDDERGRRETIDRSRVILTTEAQQDRNYTVKVTNVVSEHGDKLLNPFENTATFNGIPLNDSAAPQVQSVVATSNTTVLVNFSEPVGEKAGDASHYSIVDADGNPLVVTDATLNEFNTQVTLTTLPQAEGIQYTLTVTGIADRQGNPIDPNGATANSADFTGTSSGPPSGATEPPRVRSATSTSNTTVIVTFSEPVKGGVESAENPEHYSIFIESLDGQEIDPQSIVLVKEAVLDPDDPTKVNLTTWPQSAIVYKLQVTDVQDLAGNQVTPPDRNHPFRVTFRGTGTSGSGADSDGDGLSDAEEQLGWIIKIKLLDGTVQKREVTSDPNSSDTDQDGISDFDEKSYGINPRNADSDDDGLTDFEELTEVYSNPATQDSDGDSLSDGLEYEFFKTSALLADTDGDQFLDGDEVVLDNRNPRVADLPIVEIEVGNVDLRLDVRFQEQTSQGSTTIDSRSISTTLAQSQEQSLVKENTSTQEWFARGAAEVCLNGSCATKRRVGAKFTVEGGGGGSTTSTFTTASVQATQREYATSLSSDQEVSAESVVTRIVEGATMAAAVNLRNASNVAFTISDIEITALIEDPRDPTVFVPVATLFAASNSPISIGPLTPVRGPFRFEAQEAFPQLVESLMKNPRGLIFRVANFEIEDEYGRKFAFVEQDINDRTAFLEIDYAGNLELERFRAATNAGFDANGETTGLSMHQIMQEVLGLAFVPEAQDVNLTPGTRENADLIDTSYSTRTVGGVETLYRVRGVSPSLLNDPNRQWWVITPDGYDPRLSFADIQVFSDQAYAFKFVQDADKDFLEAAQEAMHRSNDHDPDSDNDGIGDADEVFGYFDGNGRTGWIIQLKDGQDAQQTFSNPSRADTDLDGLTDCQELAPLTDAGDCPTAIKVYTDAEGLPTLEAVGTGGANNSLIATLTLTKATDPSDPDSDSDGLTDLQEVIGFRFVDLSGQPKTLVATNTETATNPLSKDTDLDGLADYQEVLLGTNPTISDGDTVLDDDGDGLVNLRETTGWNVTYESNGGLPHAIIARSDPDEPDTDGDGLSDWEEYTGCRDRNRDLLCDTEDRFGSTRPRTTDTDGDGLWDRQEVDSVDFAGDPEQPFRFTDPRDFDMDDDYRSDGEEIRNPWTVKVVGLGGRVVYSDPLDADKDRDGLQDGRELDLGSDPNNADTDGDGALDGLEYGRITNILEPDYLVTVFYRGLQAGKGGSNADADCDAGIDTGDFTFNFRVGIPDASGAIILESVATSDSVSPRACSGWQDGGPCKNHLDQIQLASPQKLFINQSTSFAVPFTDLFTIGGRVQEIDAGGFADLSYFFGGLGTPEGSYKGSQLEIGAFDIAFNDPPLALNNRTCPVEVTVQVKVE